jgi:methyltransferase (TIGR00027 family)
MERMSRVMVARTVAIDDAIRGVTSGQVVILGAGLDGRAWRMPELAEAIVFEVDHPDTQRAKRERAGVLSQAAREVRFVPVDFTRDALDDALNAAGHDPTRPTTWLWEGVVMYLTSEQIGSTLDAVARRSAPTSRLIIVYHAPSLWLYLVGAVTKRTGEPLRSMQTVEQMRELLLRRGFRAESDEDIVEIAARLSPEIARGLRPMRHTRVVTGDR